MGWSQYAQFTFYNKSSATQDTLKLRFPDTSAHWGWPFKGTDDLDSRDEISYDSLTSSNIGPGESLRYGQTGKHNEWAGMEGTVELWTTADKKVARIFYSCPWGGDNNLEVTEVSDSWNVETPSWSKDGALGELTFTLRSKRTVGHVG